MEDVIKQAVVLWTGYKLKSYPSRDDEVIIRRYGKIEGNILLEKLKKLEKTFINQTLIKLNQI